jgi:hypothetical protein
MEVRVVYTTMHEDNLSTYIYTHVYTRMHTYTSTYIHTDIQTYRHTDIQTYRHTDIQTYRHTDIQTYRHTDIQTYRHTDRHTDIQTYRHTDIQTYRHTDIQTYIHVRKGVTARPGRVHSGPSIVTYVHGNSSCLGFWLFGFWHTKKSSEPSLTPSREQRLRVAFFFLGREFPVVGVQLGVILITPSRTSKYQAYLMMSSAWRVKLPFSETVIGQIRVYER